MKLEWVAGIASECMAGFVGIRIFFGAGPFCNLVRLKSGRLIELD